MKATQSKLQIFLPPIAHTDDLDVYAERVRQFVSLFDDSYDQEEFYHNAFDLVNGDIDEEDIFGCDLKNVDECIGNAVWALQNFEFEINYFKRIRDYTISANNLPALSYLRKYYIHCVVDNELTDDGIQKLVDLYQNKLGYDKLQCYGAIQITATLLAELQRIDVADYGCNPEYYMSKKQ